MKKFFDSLFGRTRLRARLDTALSALQLANRVIDRKNHQITSLGGHHNENLNESDMSKNSKNQSNHGKNTEDVKAFLKHLIEQIDTNGVASLNIRDRAKLQKLQGEL